MDKLWIHLGAGLWIDCEQPLVRQISFLRGRATLSLENASNGLLGAFLSLPTWWCVVIGDEMAWPVLLILASYQSNYTVQ